ncbi:glucose-6-phosphate isomerase [Candidatus Pelagibacter sp. HIMB123]|uniref:glucose-6-phosphate isomerase n=1 Tax=Candidatus Pelagibacter sp. HIMB123 TaxID=3415413 RepID=UPI003F854524
MFTENIKLIPFKNKINSSSIKKKLKIILNEDNEVLKSLGKNYQSSFKKSSLSKYYKFNNFRIIGMGGSSLGSHAIYDFLNSKIKKKFIFVNNLQAQNKPDKKKTFVNLIISKSGNTIETISNASILIKKKDKNIFITEKKNSNLYFLAEKLKGDIIHHNNYIGGRYSVLSEVGMVPAELMGLSPNNFKRFNSLIKNKNFINNLISNVASLLYLSKKKKFNSIIINYDERSDSIFKWYQQLVAESLGKKKKGFLPIVSTMPKDNHSVMQLYLDGFKNNFFTFFYVNDFKSLKIKNSLLLKSDNNLRNKSLSDILSAQKTASENIFKNKNIPFRSFEIKKRDEKTLGELFSFFILETILLGKCLDLNPYDQPAVELIKKETQKLLIKKT